jgi:hypothetical protein
MSHEVRCLRHPLTGKEPVQSHAIPCVGQNDTGTDFTPITSVFYCQCHSVCTPHTLIYVPHTLCNISDSVVK